MGCGSFWFFLIGAGAIVTNHVTGGAVRLIGGALAHGLALSVAVSSFRPTATARVFPSLSC